MKSKSSTIRIGKMRSGRYFDAPLDPEIARGPEFLEQFSLQELVDILCLSEQFLVGARREKKGGAIVMTVMLIGDSVLSKRNEPQLQKALSDLKLFNSVAFIRFARTLPK